MTRKKNASAPWPGGTGPSDEQLLPRIRRRDAEALRLLMARYDRLVRFTIFRLHRAECNADPQWLDSLASETWAAFVRGIVDQSGPTQSLKTYLIQIARHKCIDAMRRRDPADRIEPALAPHLPFLVDGNPGVEALVSEAEDLERLRWAIELLGPEDQAACQQAALICDRRWQAAAEALGVPESTLRSRWPGILNRLRAIMGPDEP